MKIASFPRALALVLTVTATALHAQVPQILNYQGRVAVGNPPVNFDGSGQFKFALVQGEGPTLLWKNDGSAGNTEPAATVTLPVTKGLYSVLLGANMTAIPASVFANPDVRLRVWFNDGTNGSQLLTPDQRIAAVGYAMVAANVPDNAITSAKIATGAVTSAKLATNAVTSANMAAGALAPALSQMNDFTASNNTRYVVEGSNTVDVTFPTTGAVGDVIEIAAGTSAGWQTLPLTPRESDRAWKAVASSSDGNKLVAVIEGGEIYTSTDSGVSWTPRESHRTWESVASSADGNKLVAVVYDGQIHTSTDSGVSWTPRATNRRWLSVASSSDGTRLVAVVYDGQIYTSTDSGVSWTPRATNRRWFSVASSSDGTKLVAVGDAEQIYTSTDSGVSWTARESIRSWDAVASSSDGTKLVAVDYGGRIYTSSDSGASWTAREGIRTWTAVASSSDGTKLVAVVNGGQIHTSTNSGVSWTARENNRNWSAVASSADGTKLAAVVYTGQIYTGQTELLSGGPGTLTRLQYQADGTWAQLAEKSIAVGAVGSAQLASNAVTSASIAAGAVGFTQMATNAIQGVNLVNGAIGTAQLASNAVTTVNIAAGAVGSAQLAGNAVTSVSLADGAVTSGKLATNAVSTNQIADGTITDVDIATTANINAAKLGSGNISTTEFNRLDGVTSGIQTQLDGKLSTADSAVTSAQLASNAVTSLKIADGTITDEDIATTANIDAAKLGSGMVSTTEFNRLDGVTSGIQTQLDGKLSAAGGTIANVDIATTANINAAKLGSGIVSTTEFNYLDGVTSGIQTQLDGKLSTAGGTLSGGLTAPAYNLSTPVTRVLQISANAFVPETQSEGYDRGAGLISPSGDTQLQFLANVHLPDGATVTKLVGVFFDGGTEDFTDIVVRMRYFSTSSLSTVIMAEILNANTIGQSGGRVEFEDTTITNAVINNTARAYTVDATFTVDAATSNTRFYGVRIEYTVNSLTP